MINHLMVVCKVDISYVGLKSNMTALSLSLE